MLSVVNIYISRDNGMEERGADTGWRARGDDIVVQSEISNDVSLFIVLCLHRYNSSM